MCLARRRKWVSNEYEIFDFTATKGARSVGALAKATESLINAIERYLDVLYGFVGQVTHVIKTTLLLMVRMGWATPGQLTSRRAASSSGRAEDF